MLELASCWLDPTIRADAHASVPSSRIVARRWTSSFRRLGSQTHRSSLDDLDVLRKAALDSDGAIHLAFVLPSVTEAATTTDRQAIETFVSALAALNTSPSDPSCNTPA